MLKLSIPLPTITHDHWAWNWRSFFMPFEILRLDSVHKRTIDWAFIHVFILILCCFLFCSGTCWHSWSSCSNAGMGSVLHVWLATQCDGEYMSCHTAASERPYLRSWRLCWHQISFVRSAIWVVHCGCSTRAVISGKWWSIRGCWVTKTVSGMLSWLNCWPFLIIP